MNTYNKDTERPLDKVVPLSLSNVKTLVSFFAFGELVSFTFFYYQ